MVLARRHPSTGGFTPLFATRDHTCLNPLEVSRVTSAGGMLAARHFGVEGADGYVITRLVSTEGIQICS